MKGVFFMSAKTNKLVWLGIILLMSTAGWLIYHEKSDESKGYTIAVVTGTTFEKKAREFTKVSEVKLYEDDNQTLQELNSGRVDAVITDRLVGLIGINEGGYKDLQLSGDLLYRETIAVAFNLKDQTLRQAVNRALKEVIDDGTYAAISRKYFGQDILEGLKCESTHPDEPQGTDDSWKKAKQAGRIRFAMSGGYPPFNFYNEHNELTGFDVEIGKAVCARLKVEYVPITTAWDGIVEGLRAKRYEGIWGSMAITPERLKVVDFSDPYYLSGAQLIVSKKSSLRGPEDLQ
jgi:ABC-type amino acid transport substrate-binding protein